MRNRKSGFTLGEVLICIMIVGIIMAVATRTIKVIKASYTALTYNEYINIKQIAAEMIAGERPFDERPAGTTTVLRTDVGYQTIITTNDQVFCETLVDMSATAGATNCTNFFDASISAGEPTLDIPNDRINSPTFTSTSGKRYYLSSRVAEGNTVSTNYGYRVMAVDLNGEQAPNIKEPNTSAPAQVPDIVTFVIMDTGEIFPVGVAADNYKYTARGRTNHVIYINSKLKGYYYIDDEGRNGVGVPEDCFRKVNGRVVTHDADGNPIDPDKAQVCNYSVVYIPNPSPNKANTKSLYTYRQAYCSSLGGKNTLFSGYCNGIAGNEFCPPSTKDEQFDVCRVENVKPAFRYNF